MADEHEKAGADRAVDLLAENNQFREINNKLGNELQQLQSKVDNLTVESACNLKGWEETSKENDKLRIRITKLIDRVDKESDGKD